MGWFERLSSNTHIQLIIVTNNRGQLLRTSYPLHSSSEKLASMFQALFVLAENLAANFEHDPARFILLSTKDHHVIIYARNYPTYYITVIVSRTAPLLLLMTELERVLGTLHPADLEALDTSDTLNAAELIQAVQEWLWERPGGGT
jgi:predicted regulator of Ras-like GTPase activity (Roadblock/LC7/MglB family)